ncbi:hypothetical protein M3P36_14305 [Altererythrobacter sp. KTW20L]|uniref:hypothetical protein n=1 Tax=Altererythrobacter sp. KTW20L TaxID=2942210 RepID=UPI0020BFC3B3|nr:hypothetical protein [Altererythrobacter sp. KTW20L]MCL6252213.1 hypothetical protein [Altererythrobacter sp. KTW20L]
MFEISPLLIPIFALAIPIVAIWTTHQRKMAEMRAHLGSSDNESPNAELAGRVKELEDRVRVLERIATDSGPSLAAQIDALRDEPASPAGVPLAFEKERV